MVLSKGCSGFIQGLQWFSPFHVKVKSNPRPRSLTKTPSKSGISVGGKNLILNTSLTVEGEEKYCENSSPLTLLPVDSLNGNRQQRLLVPKCLFQASRSTGSIKFI